MPPRFRQQVQDENARLFAEQNVCMHIAVDGVFQEGTDVLCAEARQAACPRGSIVARSWMRVPHDTNGMRLRRGLQYDGPAPVPSVALLEVRVKMQIARFADRCETSCFEAAARCVHCLVDSSHRSPVEMIRWHVATFQQWPHFYICYE